MIAAGVTVAYCHAPLSFFRTGFRPSRLRTSARDVPPSRPWGNGRENKLSAVSLSRHLPAITDGPRGRRNRQSRHHTSP